MQTPIGATVQWTGKESPPLSTVKHERYTRLKTVSTSTHERKPLERDNSHLVKNVDQPHSLVLPDPNVSSGKTKSRLEKKRS